MRKSIIFLTSTLGLVFVFFAGSVFASDITLTLIPASGDVSGPAGSTVGWGYTITNSSSNWLETLSLSAGSFSDGTPNAIFDFPAIAPDSSVTEGFSLTKTLSCSSPPCGLYEFTWASNAPMGTINSGTFTLSSDYFSGNPANPSSTDIGPAPNASAAYSVAASPVSTVPEPSSVVLVLTGAFVCLYLGRRHWSPRV